MRASDDTNFLKPNGQSRNLNIYVWHTTQVIFEASIHPLLLLILNIEPLVFLCKDLLVKSSTPVPGTITSFIYFSRATTRTVFSLSSMALIMPTWTRLGNTHLELFRGCRGCTGLYLLTTRSLLAALFSSHHILGRQNRGGSSNPLVNCLDNWIVL